MKTRGYKVLKIYAEELLCDIAVFGENSLIIDNFQCCEKILEKVPYENRAKVGSQYGNELLHNFINDMLIIH